MIPFTYTRASSADEAASMAIRTGHKLLGGGTNLVDLMRKNVELPSCLVDVTALSDSIKETQEGGVMIGAAARNSAVAAHPLVRTRYPMLSRAILAGASAQIRNMATVAGNLMQRTRCIYFNDVAGSRCNKRSPGSGCDAVGGFNRYHAIIGAAPACIATHPSDMCVALAALDARIHVYNKNATRIIPIVDFHGFPADRPDLETVLEAGDVITSIEIPVSPFAARSAYRKVRDRASYAFALVSVAAGVTMRERTIDDIRVAFGGIAPKPWRAFRVEMALRGGPATQEAFDDAVEAELARAVPLAGNAFKIGLTKRTLSAVLTELTGDAR
ncbi:FAD binding domain-containing protein [Phyllobacterium bourgognense]|uniref:Xanthine dehydrogenase YagS FAD-binding subunit n=1 Tax=Phyllobacterium bourgognense TaxID=314236 RepID=A0A368YLW7_9HYPH|nr:xanthine dehydrogenase family protein subunit M [Phyllobacterium bourgognense]RCW81231.1 xanthine dehydrogenase YagS FAD-binding subunit [Phyllobacterium bourgognense]